jgi:hypothetical protein
MFNKLFSRDIIDCDVESIQRSRSPIEVEHFVVVQEIRAVSDGSERNLGENQFQLQFGEASSSYCGLSTHFSDSDRRF